MCTTLTQSWETLLGNFPGFPSVRPSVRLSLYNRVSVRACVRGSGHRRQTLGAPISPPRERPGWSAQTPKFVDI